MRRRLFHENTSQIRAVFAACALAVGALCLYSAGASALTPGYSVGVAPASNSKSLAKNGAYFAPSLAPGQSFTGTLLVTNSNANPVTVSVYPVDGLTATGSGVTYSNQGQPVSQTGKWLTIAHPKQTLAPDSRSYTTFTITAPKGASAGDHLAGVAVESLQPSTHSSGRIAVHILTRTVVGVEVVVPGPASFDLHLGAPKITPGTYNIGQITTDMTDTGGLLGSPVLTINLKNSSGYDKSITHTLSVLLPGDTVPVSTYWPSQLTGTYTITVCARGGGLSASVCAEAVSTAGGSVTSPKTYTLPTSSGSVPLLPIILGSVLGAIVLLGGGITLGLRFARRRILASVRAVVDQATDNSPVDGHEPEA